MWDKFIRLLTFNFLTSKQLTSCIIILRHLKCATKVSSKFWFLSTSAAISICVKVIFIVTSTKRFRIFCEWICTQTLIILLILVFIFTTATRVLIVPLTRVSIRIIYSWISNRIFTCILDSLLRNLLTILKALISLKLDLEVKRGTMHEP